jgi:hypothetical protein
MILDRSETAPAKAMTMIEHVDYNTLTFVATFPSQSEAERQTGISRTMLLAVCTPFVKLLLIYEADNLVLMTFCSLKILMKSLNNFGVVIFYISVAPHARAILSS